MAPLRMDPVRMLPASWKCDAVVTRGGGKDRFGNTLPTQNINVKGCLWVPRSTADPVDHSDLVSKTGVIYHSDFIFRGADRITIPAGKRGAGTWSVDGDLNEWPLGTEVPLVKA